MNEYEQYTHRERKQIAALQRRRDWLKARIDASPVDLAFDKEEYSALTWALGVICNAGKGSNGISEGQKLD